MPAQLVNRDERAQWYASQHLKADPGIVAVHYLPKGASEREIRLAEVNEQIVERDRDSAEPIDFGVDIGGETPHTLVVLDVTPSQWGRILRGELELPPGWSLEDAVTYSRR